jgi:hypothetical protein
MTKDRRPLRFDNLNEVMADIDRLLQAHHTVGNWSLGQICNHLTLALRCTLDGFPPGSSLPWIVQQTLGKVAFKLILKRGRLIEGFKIPDKYLPIKGLDAREEANTLSEVIREYQSTTTPLATHFLFGPLTKEQWLRYHCIHCAHHLSFAIPD